MASMNYLDDAGGGGATPKKKSYIDELIEKAQANGTKSRLNWEPGSEVAQKYNNRAAAQAQQMVSEFGALATAKSQAEDPLGYSGLRLPTAEDVDKAQEVRQKANKAATKANLERITTAMSEAFPLRLSSDDSFYKAQEERRQKADQAFAQAQQTAAAANDRYNQLARGYQSGQEQEFKALAYNPDFARYSKGDAGTASDNPNGVYYRIYHRNDASEPEKPVSEAAGALLASEKQKLGAYPKGTTPYAQMTDSEAEIFFYLWDSPDRGPEQAKAYLKLIEPKLNARAERINREADVQYAHDYPVQASLTTLPLNAMGGVMGMADITAQNIAAAKGSRRPIDYNTGYQQPGKMVSTIRGTVAQDLETKYPDATLFGLTNLPSFAYQTAMSMADSGIQAMLVGTFGAGTVAAKVAEGLSLTVMGAAAAQQSVFDAKARGASDQQALLYGWATGINEAVFEKLSLDNLVNGIVKNAGRTLGEKITKDWTSKFFRHLGSALIDAGIQGGIEASEEVFTSLADAIADKGINKTKSELSLRAEELKAELIAQGMKPADAEQEAVRRAIQEFTKGVFLDGLGGFFSGLGMGGTGVIARGSVNAGRSVIEDIRAARTQAEERNPQVKAQNVTDQDGMPRSEVQTKTAEQEKLRLPSEGDQQARTERQKDPLTYALNKLAAGETLTGGDVKAVMENPKAMIRLGESGVRFQGSASEQRTQVRAALEAMSQQQAAQTAQKAQEAQAAQQAQAAKTAQSAQTAEAVPQQDTAARAEKAPTEGNGSDKPNGFGLRLPTVEESETITNPEESGLRLPAAEAPAQASGLKLPTVESNGRSGNGGTEILWTTAKDGSGWRTEYSNPPLLTIFRDTNVEIVKAMAEEARDNGNSPLSGAVFAVSNAVREGTISPMAGAELINRAWQAGSDSAGRSTNLQLLYDPDSGAITQRALNTARRIDAEHRTSGAVEQQKQETSGLRLPTTEAPAHASGLKLPTVESGENAENRNGGQRNGQQTEAADAAKAAAGEGIGNDLDDGGRGRIPGQRSGEQNGRLGENAEGRRDLGQPGKAIRRRADAKNLRAEEVNAREHIREATGTITLVPEEMVRQDKELRDVARRLEAITGKKVLYTIGNIQRKGKDGSISQARGAITGKEIILRCDHSDLTVTQLAAHELFHYYAKQFPGLVEQMKERIIRRYSAEEFNKVAEVYVLKLGAVEGLAENLDEAAAERALAAVEEEIFADAYGSINAFGAKADSFTEEVRAAVNETVGEETAAATERKTGPPEETKWSTQEEVLALENVDWMGDWTSIRDQLRIHADEISKIEPVAVVEYSKEGVDDLDAVMLDAVSKIGGSRIKRGSVAFEFDKKAARVIRGHAKSTTELRAAAMASPYVAKYGKLIAGHKNHEGHGTTTLTYAAPVIINGTTVNEGVAIQFTADGRPHAVNVELQDGDAFVIDMTKAPEGTNSRVYRYGKGTALSKSDAFDDTIAETERKSKKESEPESNFSTDEEEAIPQSAAEYRQMQKNLRQQSMAQRTLSEETKAKIKELEAEIERRSDKAHQDQIYNEQGADALAKEVAAVRRLEKQAERLRNPKAKKPVAKSRAIIAKNDLKKTLLSSFSIPAGMKAEVGGMIDQFAEKLIRDKSLTEADRRELFNRLYSEGVMEVQPDEYFQAARALVKGGRIYVPEGVKADFGDDWAEFRKEAFAQGIYLTGNPNDRGADSWNAELAEEFPGLFHDDNYDARDILETIVKTAREGRAEKLSLAEYAAQVVGREYVSEDELLDNMERQLDWSLRTFAEKAGLEIYLRDRTGKIIAEEREKAEKAIDAMRARELARLGKEREQRKEAARRQAQNRELREMQQRTLKQLQWLSKNRFKFSGDMQAQVDAILQDIDIYAASAADEMHLDKQSGRTWKDLRDMYLAAKENDPNFLPSKELERIVSRLDNKKIGDLDIGALTDLYKAAVGLRTELYNRNNVIEDELHSTFEEVYDAAKGEIRSAPGGYETGAKGARDTFFNDWQLTPMNRLLRMAGWNPDSRWYGMAKMLEKGERAQRKFKTEAARRLAPVLTQYKDWMKTADGQGKNAKWYEIEVPANWEYRMGDKPVFSTETVKVWMTPAQKVHMYLESKNFDNLRHMEGGRTFPNKELYSKGKRAEAFAQGTTVKLLPETVKQIVSDLTPEEQALADALEQFYNGFSKEEINRVSRALYGYDKAMEGSYAPIYTNNNYTKSEPGIFDTTAEGVGNLKSRVVSANPTLNLSAFDAFEKSVDKTSRFVGMAIPIRNMTTLLNWREQGNSMKDVIDHKWGEKATKWTEDLLTELQSGRTSESSSIESLTDKALSRYIGAVFGFNPSIVLKQFASYPLAAAYLGWENMPLWIPGAARVDTDLMAKYTGELDYRLLGYATPETAAIKDNPGRLRERGPLNFLFGGGAITWMDGFTVRTLWSWAENKVQREHPDMEIGTQEQIDAGQSPYYKAVAAEFEEAVSRSQPMYDTMHRSNIMRESNPLTRAFTLFKTVPQQEYNMLRQTAGEAAYYKRTGADKETQAAARQKAGRAFEGVLAGNLMIGAITFLNALWKNRGKKYRDEDGELTAESVIAQAGKQYLKDSAGLLIGGGELADILSSILFGDKWYGLEMPGLEQLGSITEDVIDATKTMGKLVKDSIGVMNSGGDWAQYMRDHSDTYIKAVDNVASTLGTYGTGLPIDNVKAYLLGTLQWLSPEIRTAYEDAMKKAEKSGLKGLSGASLEMRTAHILQDRAGGAEESTIEELARLYAGGHTDAIPAAQQTKVSVNGDERSLNIGQQQTYKNVWSDTVNGALDELVGSELYEAADDDTKTKMLKRLYDLATMEAKAALFDDFEDSALNKAEDLRAAGMARADYVAAVSQFNAIGNEDIGSYERGARQRDMINGLIYSDSIKLRLYETLTNATSRVEKLRKIMDTGLDFSEVMDIYDKYASLDAQDGAKAGDKAKAFALWVDTQRFTGEQKAAIKDQLGYGTNISADTERYDKFTGLGLTPEEASRVDEALSGLSPLPGKSGISNAQKWNAALNALGSSASQKKQMDTVSAFFDTDYYTSSGAPSQWNKLNRVVNSGVSVRNALGMIENDTLDTYIGWMDSDAKKAGVKSDTYLAWKDKAKSTKTTYDANGKAVKGEERKDKLVAYINGMSLTSAQKDTLFLEEYKESGLKNTPWHKGGGGSGGKNALATFSRTLKLPTVNGVPAQTRSRLRLPTVDKPRSGLVLPK